MKLSAIGDVTFIAAAIQPAQCAEPIRIGDVDSYSGQPAFTIP